MDGLVLEQALGREYICFPTTILHKSTVLAASCRLDLTTGTIRHDLAYKGPAVQVTGIIEVVAGQVEPTSEEYVHCLMWTEMSTGQASPEI